MGSGNWIVDNLNSALEMWNGRLAEIWQLISTSPESFKGGGVWNVIVNINDGLKAVGYALLVLFFVMGVVKTCGSFTELKHDTVLYAKQVMAEMGGGPPEELDDRGYVEPETEVYRRFAELAEQTAAGLQVYGILDPADRENLTRLASLARSLETISRKELRNERLSDEEYDLIREYGGTLEHFWIEAVKDRTDAEYLDAREIPASLVTDIATDPNGTVLQAANGRPAQIYVIVPVDGALRIASGVVYNFYQFCQPLSARLTDSEWRQMIGEWMSPDGRFHQDETPEKPWWTQSYWVQG